MAKVKAPLFSLGASGSLAKTLVYGSWKGLNIVREHVIPTNPKTTAQGIQRAYMTAALTEFHGAAYTEADITAFARLAGAEGSIMTGFNRMVKAFIDEAVDGNTWTRIKDATFTAIADDRMTITVDKVAAGRTVICMQGTRKTFFTIGFPLEDQADGTWSVIRAGLTPSTLYYFWLYVGDPGTDYGRLGVYTARTIAS